MSKVAVIVVAAGKGERFGGSENKVLARIDGQPMFIRSLQHFISREDVCQTILTIAPEDEEHFRLKFGPNLGFMGVRTAIGGATRAESVAKSLELVEAAADLVAIHDAARPCVTKGMIDAVFAEAAKTGAAILAAPLRGTLKRVSGSRVIDQTMPREGLWEAQTPQVFKRSVIMEAYAKRAEFQDEPTDDAQLVEATGYPVAVVECDFSNLKVTTKADLGLAGAIIRSRPAEKVKALGSPFEEAQW